MAENVLVKRLRCPKCRKFYLNKDPVLLDVLNTVIHLKCYTPDTYPIKDRGTYREIITKYDFFRELV